MKRTYKYVTEQKYTCRIKNQWKIYFLVEKFLVYFWVLCAAARAFLEESSRQKKDLTSISNPAEYTADSSHSGNQNINVLVTSGSLVPSIVKCLLFRLDEFFLTENGIASYLMDTTLLPLIIIMRANFFLVEVMVSKTTCIQCTARGKWESSSAFHG